MFIFNVSDIPESYNNKGPNPDFLHKVLLKPTTSPAIISYLIEILCKLSGRDAAAIVKLIENYHTDIIKNFVEGLLFDKNHLYLANNENGACLNM